MSDMAWTDNEMTRDSLFVALPRTSLIIVGPYESLSTAFGSVDEKITRRVKKVVIWRETHVPTSFLYTSHHLRDGPCRTEADTQPKERCVMGDDNVSDMPFSFTYSRSSPIS